MKEAKPYIICGVVVILLLCLKLNTWSASFGSIEEFRGATLQEDVFYPLIAKSINKDKRLYIKVDGADVPNQFD